MAGLALVAAAGSASGCMSSPTYGTDKTANEQLVSDLGGILSFTPKKRAPIDYEPRPQLVKPAKGDETLPPPQEAVATAGNPNWPESPEQRLARIRADATANQDNPNYQSPVEPDMALASGGTPFKKTGEAWHKFESDNQSVSDQSAQSAEFKRRLAENQQGSETSRKYLSEPPLDYRQAAADAPQGDPGEDEAKKERRLKHEARKKSGRGFQWEDLNPF